MKKTLKSILLYSLLITLIIHSFLFLLAIILSDNSYNISAIQTYHGILFFCNFFMNFVFDYDNIAIGITISIIFDYCLSILILTFLIKLSGKTPKWYTALAAFFILAIVKFASMSALLSHEISSL